VRTFSIILLSFIIHTTVQAQMLNLYSRIVDPRGIARLDGPDTGRTKSVCFHGNPIDWNEIDLTDHSGIVAEDTGSGVITHIWNTSGVPDSQVIMKLYINDTLVLADFFNEFFGKIRGVLRPPLDSFGSGAYTWDIQIPYHKGFRLTVITPNPNLYFGIMWHSVPEQLLPWFKLYADSAAQATQIASEQRLHQEVSPWNDWTAIRLFRTDTLQPFTSTIIANLSGSAILQILQFQPAFYDFATLDSTWLDIYWDGCPTPSVHVPLKDFFLSPVAVTKVRALQLQADPDSGFVSYFPMPFYNHATVELVRFGSTPLPIRSLIQYNPEYIDRNSYGYFHADFNESNPTKYHVYHPVVHTVGRGRFIGMGFGVMGSPYAVFLEGDPIFSIDSDNTYHVHYTGGEDYFDAAWWFPNGPFTLPFAGYTHYVDQFYRFQYSDCYEFTHSFDFDLQPGGDADIYDHYRTVGFYYMHWTPFWTNRDTLAAGELWTIAGSGYASKQKITIVLGPVELDTEANVGGTFHFALQIPSDWKPGIYNLTVNGEAAPQKYYVLAGPAIRGLVDTLPITRRAGDSLYVSGTGFQPGERVVFYLDSITLNQSVIADSTNGFVTMLRIPYLAEHAYLLIARGERSGNATARDRVTLTRTIDLEFEDLMPPTYKTPGECWAEDVSYFWEATWSKQMFVYFKPDTIFQGAALEFGFRIAHADTFAIAFHNSVGLDLGQYSVAINGKEIGQVDGCHPNPNGDPFPSGPLDMGTHYLDTGIHKIRFTCLGKAGIARNYWIEPDNLVLRPVTYMAPNPGTLHTNFITIGPLLSNISIYPNPLMGPAASIAFTLGSSESSFFSGKVFVQVYDILGRSHAATLNGEMLDGEFRGTLSTALSPGTYFVRTVISTENGETLQLPVVPMKVE
jgi:hypothetical protein